MVEDGSYRGFERPIGALEQRQSAVTVTQHSQHGERAVDYGGKWRRYGDPLALQHVPQRYEDEQQVDQIPRIARGWPAVRQKCHRQRSGHRIEGLKTQFIATAERKRRREERSPLPHRIV